MLKLLSKFAADKEAHFRDMIYAGEKAGQVERPVEWASSTAESFFNTEYPRFLVSTKFILDIAALIVLTKDLVVSKSVA